MDTRLRDTEAWFVAHGLPWFVPELRHAARDNLRSRVTYLRFLVLAAVSLVLGVGLAYLSGSAAVAPATLINLTGLAAVVYAGRTLGGWPIVRWAGRRALASLPMLIPLVTRALPLLLLFVTFLFINAEVWQLSSRLDGGVLWVTVLLFVIFAALFLLARLSEEVDAFDAAGDSGGVAAACRRTPLEGAAAELRTRGDAGAQRARLTRYERTNLLLVLAIAQGVQVILLALSVFVFFMLFGGLVMTHDVQQAWVGDLETIRALPVASNLSIQLFQVSVFLAAFSGFYFTVYAVTDDALRGQFFTRVVRELERAVAVRSVYVTLRSDGIR